MAVTAERLARALRVDDPANADTLAEMTRLIAVSRAVVKRRVPSAPSAVCDECIIRLAGYLFDAPPAAPGATYSSAWLSSGCAGLTAPWRSHSAGVVGD